jgi:hypothetical protein
MDKKQYQQLQKTVNRTKQGMLAQVIYSVLFWGFVAILLCYFLPLGYYKLTSNHESYQAPPSAVGILNSDILADPLRDSALENYRYYWYEMGQRNLHYDPINSQPTLSFLGKKDIYPVISRLGKQKRVAYTIEDRYFFNQVTSTIVSSDTLNAFAPSATMYDPSNEIGTYDDFLNYLASFGEGKVGEISITFKNTQVPSELREKLSQLVVQHYSIEYKTESIFGYSDEMVQQQSGNDYNQRVFDSVLQGLTFLEKHYNKYGNLGWDVGENIQFTNNLTDQINFYDFGDILDFVEDNGVKVSAVHVSATCEQLAQWLTENRKLVMRVQLQQLSDNVIQDVFTEGA